MIKLISLIRIYPLNKRIRWWCEAVPKSPGKLEPASGLKVIARVGVCVDNIDVEVATVRGIMVVNSLESASAVIAELTL